jgi:hypothetical protein
LIYVTPSRSFRARSADLQMQNQSLVSDAQLQIRA